MLVLAMQFSKSLEESGYRCIAGKAEYRSLKTKEKTTNILFFSEIHPVRDSRIID